MAKKKDKRATIFYSIELKNKFTDTFHRSEIKMPIKPTAKDLQKLKENYFCYEILSLKPIN